MSLRDKFNAETALSRDALPSSVIKPLEPEYGVDVDDKGNIVLELGMSSVAIPKDVAAKFALLILKRCGYKVDFDG